MASEDDMAPQAAPETPVARRRWPWRKYVLGLPVVFLAFLALLVQVMDSPIGHRLLTDLLASWENERGLGVSIGRIEGSLFGEARLEDVRLRDPQGVFLRAPVIDLDWRPFNWFRHGLDIRNLAIRRALWVRRPELRPGEPNQPLLPSFDIRIDHLTIDRLTLGEALLAEKGKKTPLSLAERRVDLRGGLLIARRKAHLSVQAHLGSGDRLLGMIEADEAANRFNLGFDYVAPRNGLLATLTHAPAPRHAWLGGAGQWTNWQGSLAVDESGKRLAAAHLAWNSGAVRVAGQVAPAPFLSERWRPVVGPQVTVRGAGQWRDGEVSGGLGLASATAQVGAVGRVGITGGKGMHLGLSARLGLPLPLNDTMRLQGLALRAQVSGTPMAPVARFTASAQSLVTRRVTLTGMAGQGEIRREKGHWVLPVELAAARVRTGDPAYDAYLSSAHAKGVLHLAGQQLNGDGLDLRIPGAAAHFALRADFDRDIYALAGQVSAHGLEVKKLGRADGQGHMVLSFARGGVWRLGLDAQGALGPVENATLVKMAGEKLAYTVSLTTGSGLPVQIAHAGVDSDHLTLTFTGHRQDDGTFALTGTGKQATYGSFTATLEMASAGMSGQLHLQDPVPLAGLRDVNLAFAPEDNGWHITTDGQSMLGPFNGQLGLALPDDAPPQLAVRQLQVAQTQVSGELQLVDSGAQGHLLLKGGGVDGNLALVPRGGGQGVDLNLDMREAHFGGDKPLTIANARLTASGLILHQHTTITATAAAQGIGMGKLFIGRLAVNAKLTDGSGQVTVALGGRRGSRFDLTALADVAPGKISALAHGSFAGQPIAMPRKLELTAQQRPDGTTEAWRLAPSEVDYGGGRAIASGLFGNGALDLKLALANLPLSLGDVVLPDLGLGGKVSGLFTWDKAREALPQAQVQLVVKGLSRSGLVLTSRPIDLAVIGHLNQTALEARAVASEGGKTSGRLQAHITDLPAEGRLAERLRSGHLFAQMRYSGPADALWRLMALNSFDLTGPVALAADVNGTLADPHIRGSLASDNLRLQSADTGTDVTQITTRGGFDGSVLTITRLDGRTGNGGDVVGAGRVDFAHTGNHGPAFDLKLAGRKALLLNRPDLALVATGPLRILSDGEAGTVAGRLVIDSARWRLGQSSTAAALPNIKTHEINRRADIAPASDSNMAWRLLVDAQGKNGIRVQGLGLDSYWGADIRLRGTLDDPAIGGHADLVQGSYEFAGTSFTLNQGKITFDGTSPPNPQLDIAASADVNSVSATVTVRGTSLRPEIAFTSVPALPEDELLSRLLFGDSITQISAPEAVQLGSALAALHGGGGLDPINKVRSVIGLDRLRIVSPDATVGRTGTGVAVGKYIGRRVYAELVSDGRGYSATNLEYRITRWLAILGSASTVGRQSINTRLSHDY